MLTYHFGGLGVSCLPASLTRISQSTQVLGFPGRNSIKIKFFRLLVIEEIIREVKGKLRLSFKAFPLLSPRTIIMNFKGLLTLTALATPLFALLTMAVDEDNGVAFLYPPAGLTFNYLVTVNVT